MISSFFLSSFSKQGQHYCPIYTYYSIKQNIQQSIAVLTLKQHQLSLTCQAFLEQVLLIQVVYDPEVVGSQILQVYESSLELTHHFVEKVYLVLRDLAHVTHSTTLSETLHQFTLFHSSLQLQAIFSVTPKPPNTLADKIRSNLAQFTIFLQFPENIQGLGLTQITQTAFVRTTTKTETINTPQLTQSAPINLPMGVLGEQLPQPTEVMVITVIQAMLPYIVRGERVQIYSSAILNMKENKRTLMTKMVAMKENGASLKIDLRVKAGPDRAPYILHILQALGDMQILPIRQEAAKKQLRNTLKMISMQLSLKEYSVYLKVMLSTAIGYSISKQAPSAKGYGIMNKSSSRIIKEGTDCPSSSSKQKCLKMILTIKMSPTIKES